VLTADYARYADINQAVNLAVYRRFARENIRFAYPTRTVVLQNSSLGIHRETAATPNG
jgi:small-conductance mechanosensitive channel